MSKRSAPTKFIIGVQFNGDTGFVPLAARGDKLIGFLAKQIKKELGLSTPLNRITLRLMVGKGADGKDTFVKLNSMDKVGTALNEDTIAKALGKDKTDLGLDMNNLRIIVDVTETATTTTAAAGACARRVLCSCARSR